MKSNASFANAILLALVSNAMLFSQEHRAPTIVVEAAFHISNPACPTPEDCAMVSAVWGARRALLDIGLVMESRSIKEIEQQRQIRTVGGIVNHNEAQAADFIVEIGKDPLLAASAPVNQRQQVFSVKVVAIESATKIWSDATNIQYTYLGLPSDNGPYGRNNYVGVIGRSAEESMYNFIINNKERILGALTEVAPKNGGAK